ncbi:hypothetical protein ABT093_24035 [Kitasatospora sp. NPDC002551]|uniref:hypothetical protein n=1 Tax=Kitasatospora sp. NPDC002551 TaxID=3154539 RepID=UPI00332486B8
MTGSRPPNHRLRALLDEAALSGEGLARAVNRAGVECGLVLRYDRTSVSHWLAGSLPMEPVPGLLCEVLSRWLGRPVAPEHAGLARPAAPVPEGGDRPAAADVLAFLGRAEPRRPVPPYTLTGLVPLHPMAGDAEPPREPA